MKLYKNNAQDLIMKHGVKTYDKLQKIFDFAGQEFVSIHYMLALLGFDSKNRVSLDTKPTSDLTRSFSIRTTYPKNSTEMDTQYGLFAILDNTQEDYDHIVNHVAFEKTEINNTPFFKMTNVKTYYEYMQGGLDYFEKEFFQYGNNLSDIADAINEYLEEDIDQINFNIDDILSETLINED